MNVTVALNISARAKDGSESDVAFATKQFEFPCAPETGSLLCFTGEDDEDITARVKSFCFVEYSGKMKMTVYCDDVLYCGPDETEEYLSELERTGWKVNRR